MALETTHQWEFRLALAELLEASPVFADVQISRFPVDPDKALAPAWIELWDTTMDAEWGLLGAQSQDEEFTLRGRIVVLMAGAGSEQEIQLIEQAETLCAELETIMRANYKMPTMDGAIRDAILTEIETIPLYTASGLAMLVPFSIRVSSQIRYV